LLGRALEQKGDMLDGEGVRDRSAIVEEVRLRTRVSPENY
jgi:hypothetical protein